jgi:hypothetical protein
VQAHTKRARGPLADFPALLETTHVAANPRVDPTACGSSCSTTWRPVSRSHPSKSPHPAWPTGDAGWLIEGADPTTFEQSIPELLEVPEHASALGRNACRDHYRWPILAERVERVCEAVLKRA